MPAPFDPPDPESKRKLDHFDWSKMRFASDRVTVELLRKHSEGDFSFSVSGEILQSGVFDSLETVMTLERELAQIAFCQAAGIPERPAGVSYGNRGEVVRCLFEEYASLGVTAGKLESSQWIQSIEAQARIQARPFSSRGRH